MIEETLTNNDLHGLAQYYSFHYGGGFNGIKNRNYPREDIIDLVDEYLKANNSKKGFLKWFCIEYGIYHKFRRYSEKERVEFINNHIKEPLIKSVIKNYLNAKKTNKVFVLENIDDLRDIFDGDMKFISKDNNGNYKEI